MRGFLIILIVSLCSCVVAFHFGRGGGGLARGAPSSAIGSCIREPDGSAICKYPAPRGE